MINKENINTVTKEHPFANPNDFVYRVIYTDGRWFSVPHEEKNMDYQEILLWVADGNTIEEAD
jgi:hypothetical protein